MTPSEARAAMVEALTVVLPGRVQPFPPTSKRYITPSIFLEQLTLGEAPRAEVATFPVWVLSDGAVQAQIAQHDDIVWNSYLALRPLTTGSITARPVALSGFRATVLDVMFDLDDFTMCAPTPAQPVPIDRRTLAG